MSPESSPARHRRIPRDCGLLTTSPLRKTCRNGRCARCLPGPRCSGVAPKANLVSLKVLDDNGNTLSSAVIEAIDYVRTVNGGGRDLQIHGVNLSLGCPWPPTEFAAGQSPLCRELDLLVGTGVIAVVSAGNAGAGWNP